MNTLIPNKIQAYYSDGNIHVSLDTDVHITFPVAKNPRLCNGTNAQLNRIEVSPFGLHWPDLDEDLSFEGLGKGDYGQSMTRCR